MKPWLRWTLRGATALIALAAAAAAAGAWLGERQRTRIVSLPALPTDVAFASGSAALERGRYLFESRGCSDCHGSDGAGRVFVDDGAGLRLKGPNISPGPGNVVAGYTIADWDRTVRHGVKRDGRPLLVMPSEDYNRLTDADLAALAAYVRALPPAAGGPAIVELPLPARVLYGYGAIKDAAAKIDHGLPPQSAVPEGVSVAYGRYVAQSCKGCHGAQFAGGRIPGGPPDWPPAARLASGKDSVMPRYPDADALIKLFRSGRRADGSVVRVMPFESLSKMSETDLRALYLYLRTL